MLSYPIRPGAMLVMPTGARAVVVELLARSVLLRYLVSEELVEMTRETVGALPRCGYMPRELLILLIPVDLEDDTTAQAASNGFLRTWREPEIENAAY